MSGDALDCIDLDVAETQFCGVFLKRGLLTAHRAADWSGGKAENGPPCIGKDLTLQPKTGSGSARICRGILRFTDSTGCGFRDGKWVFQDVFLGHVYYGASDEMVAKNNGIREGSRYELFGTGLKGLTFGAVGHGPKRRVRLRDNPDALEEATDHQISRILTVLLRQDRFAEGSLLQSRRTSPDTCSAFCVVLPSLAVE